MQGKKLLTLDEERILYEAEKRALRLVGQEMRSVRSYDLKVNVATKKAALRCVLSEKLRENQLVLLESLELPTHRTQDLAAAMTKLGITGKALLLDRRENGNLSKAARNNPDLFVEDALGLDAYAALEAKTVILTEKALKTVTEVLG